MPAKLYSAETIGLTSHIITVEVDITRGLHSFSIVGLPDKVVEESRERIGAAIKNSGFAPPRKGNKRIVVSLAPADIKKEGPLFDLPIALGILLASREVRFDAAGRIFLGELALNGELRPIRGALLITRAAQARGFKEIFLPQANAQEAALIHGIAVYGARSLQEVVRHINKSGKAEEGFQPLPQTQPTDVSHTEDPTHLDLSLIAGQEVAKRGLTIAAAGGHNIAFVGPPGTGKTLLAKAFRSILPPLSFDETLEVTGIHSVAGTLRDRDLVTTPPFRAPHHTASFISLVGGGTWPKPGEVTLAHRGVLFLDEFPEFEKRVIESLRGPLEDRTVTVTRIKDSETFPADFILLAAMNHCPCGNTGRSSRECVCGPAALERYRRKISGPISDRIDLWLSVPEVPIRDLKKQSPGGESKQIRDEVLRARKRQRAFFASRNAAVHLNAQAGPREIKQFFRINDEGTHILHKSVGQLGLSARGYHKMIKVAKTIADLDNKDEIEGNHMLEALQYRPQNELI